MTVYLVYITQAGGDQLWTVWSYVPKKSVSIPFQFIYFCQGTGAYFWPASTGGQLVNKEANSTASLKGQPSEIFISVFLYIKHLHLSGVNDTVETTIFPYTIPIFMLGARRPMFSIVYPWLDLIYSV
jgi:hypothetical protein